VSESEIATEYVKCDLCGGARSEPVLTGRDMLHGTPGDWQVVQCGDCGLVYTNPRPRAESAGLVYPADYRPHQAKKHKKRGVRERLWRWAMEQHWNYPPRGESFGGRWLSWSFLLWAKRHRRNFDLFAWEGQGKLLDYGCGGGGYLVRMKELGWDVSGMDMSQAAVDACRREGLDVCVGAAPAEKFERGSFDVVTLWHVAEHVPSPTETLRQINAVLKLRGKVVMAMPNFGSLSSRQFGPYWFGLDLPRHLTHFSPGSISWLLEKTGFVVEKIFAQRHGQITQKSFKYLADDTGKWRHTFLARSKRLCSIIERTSTMVGGPGRMVVHARKVEEVFL